MMLSAYHHEPQMWRLANSSPQTLHISHNDHSKVTHVERCSQMEKCGFFNRRWRSAPSAGLIPALDDLIKLQANFTIGRCGKEILIIPVLQASHYHKDSDIVLRPTCSPASSHGNYRCWIRGPSRQVDRLLHQHPKYMTSSSLCSCLHMDGNHQLPNLWNGTSNVGLNSKEIVWLF